MTQGWIGVDLDGTLAHYEGWRGEEHIGEPVPLMAARVKEWIGAGKTVKIFTARVAGRPDSVREVIASWSQRHFGVALEVTNVKDFGMVELWDDRAIQVLPNTGRRADGRD